MLHIAEKLFPKFAFNKNFNRIVPVICMIFALTKEKKL